MRPQVLLPGKYLAAALVLFLGALFVFHTRANSITPAMRDAERMNDLKRVQGYLDSYFNKCGYYPGGVQRQPACSLWVYTNTWEGMGMALTESKLGITKIPVDPLPGRSYSFEVAKGGKGYVLGALLEDQSNPSLAQSAHGVFDGLDCSGTMYCIQVSKP